MYTWLTLSSLAERIYIEIGKPPAGAGSRIFDLVPNLEDEEGDHPQQSGDLKAPSEENWLRSQSSEQNCIFDQSIHADVLMFP